MFAVLTTPMDRTERFYKIDQLLHERKTVHFATFAAELGVSRATFKRDLEYMRSRLNAPIAWDRDAGGYRYMPQERHAAKFALPGLWFSAEEIHALMTMQQLLAGLEGGGLLGPHIQPLLARLTALLGANETPQQEIRRRIRIIGIASRKMPLQHFSLIGTALVKRRRLRLVHYVRSRDETVEREVSPQRLVHYRDNWYLDAWCHLRNELRSFSLDAVRRAEMIERRARDIAARDLDAVLASGYGIFSGATVQWAKLRFTPERARWVASEQWHPQQRAHYDADGHYILELPYAQPTELVMDILRHGRGVEVIGPPPLRQAVQVELQSALQAYAEFPPARSGAAARIANSGDEP
jgi:predicted DNA-binding transcriptional regulator YafY